GTQWGKHPHVNFSPHSTRLMHPCLHEIMPCLGVVDRGAYVGVGRNAPRPAPTVGAASAGGVFELNRHSKAVAASPEYSPGRAPYRPPGSFDRDGPWSTIRCRDSSL